MKKKWSDIIFGSFILIAIGTLFWWQSFNPVKSIVLSEPGMDNRITGDSIVEVIKIGEMYTSLAETSATGVESWPRFRGAEYDNISKSKIALIDAFPPEGPKKIWSVELGEGHSGAAIYDGKAYVLDYDELRRADLLRCFELTTGTEIWQRGYRVAIKRNHGMARTIPAISEKYIVTVGPRGQVMCLDRVDGNFRWGIDLIRQFQSELPFWYTGQCPLIDQDVAILAPGGTHLMIALDCETGDTLWETPNPRAWKMSHASIIPWNYGGRKTYVYSAVGGVCGIAADGPDAGTVLWETTAWNHSVVAPSAVCMPDGRIFLSAGYGAGSMLVQIVKTGAQWDIHVLDEFKPVDGLASEQQTPILFGGKLFGILPKDAGPYRNQFVCVDPADPRKILWSSGKETRFGLGPYFIADNKFFILSDEGELTMARLSTRSWEQLGSFKVLEGHDAWAPFALADGFMILRDSKTMICLDMRK